MPFAPSMQERFVTLHGPVKKDEFSKEHVCVLGDMHENVEPLHRSNQEQTDDATKSWEALTDALTNNPGFFGTVASWKTTFSTRGASCNFSVRSFASHRTATSHGCACSAVAARGTFKNMQVPMPGFAVVVRSDTSLLVHAMPVQSFLNLGTATSAVPQFLESADGQDSWRSTVSC